MKGPLLYRPAPRWQVIAAFGGAIALHLAAVGIAAIRPTEKVVDLSDIPEATVEMSIETQQEPPQPTPPPEEEPPPPPPPEAIPEEKPEFVEEKITGSGVCVMTVDSGSGSVTSAEMAQSTGSPILDNAATSAFRRWRFKPGTVSRVRTPITFTMSGAQY